MISIGMLRFQRNRELIGKYAMKDLVSKLPRPDQRARDASVGDATIGAVLGILFETVKHSADFTRLAFVRFTEYTVFGAPYGPICWPRFGIHILIYCERPLSQT